MGQSPKISEEWQNKEMKLFQNIINKLRNDNVNIYKNIKFKKLTDLKDIDKSNCYINTNLLAIENDEDMEYMLRILTCILRAELMDVMRKKVSKETRKRRIV